MRVLVFAACVAMFAACPLAAQEPQRVVRGLKFEGNHAIDSYTLSTAISTSNSSFFARVWPLRLLGLGDKRDFDELEFRRDVVRLVLLYRQSGYMAAAVDTAVRRTENSVWVTFIIYEGRPVRVTRFEITGLDSVLDVNALQSDLPLQLGAPFNRFLFQASADTILARLHNAGRPGAQVFRNFDVDAGRETAEVSLDVVPGPRARVGAVEVEGLDKVDTGTVRRLLTVKPNDLYREDQLYESQRALYGTGLFRSATVTLEDSTLTGSRDTTVRVRVSLREGSRHRVLIGAGYGSYECFRAQSGWSAYDFLGGARTLDLTGQISKLGIGAPTDVGLRNTLCESLKDDDQSDTVNYSLNATVHQPFFLSPRHSATAGVFLERRSEFQAYTRVAVGFNLGVTFNARREVPVTLGYEFSVGRTAANPAVYCSVFRLCALSDQGFLSKRRRFAAVTVTAIRNLVNSPLDPTRGSLITVNLLHSSRFTGSDPLYEFNRGEVEVSKYYPLGRRGVFAWRVRSGTVLPQKITLSGQSASYVPPDQRFYGGGPNSVRGFARNELGPRVYVTTDTTRFKVQNGDTTYTDLRTSPTGGNSAFVFNAELRLPAPVLSDRLRFATFVDVGQVWERGTELASVSGVRVTPGIGLRYATPLGPVRLDAAYNGYAAEPGVLYYENDTTHALTVYRQTYSIPRAASFWNRVVWQFAVGEAF
ncbi:MAG TPA: BamA/TamA family outer membrane protein [Gemmatimonadales bacterium]|nr:BamA/TamA family outer membrane protein [Gemmatimonadales bacterium]